MIGDAYDSVIFFDDDFVPSCFWIERMIGLFESNPNVVGLSGSILVDGATTAGISLDDAIALVETKDKANVPCSHIAKSFSHGNNVGCNMAYRISAIGGLKFDQNLPRYAWLEGSDMRG